MVCIVQFHFYFLHPTTSLFSSCRSAHLIRISEVQLKDIQAILEPLQPWFCPQQTHTKAGTGKAAFWSRTPRIVPLQCLHLCRVASCLQSKQLSAHVTSLHWCNHIQVWIHRFCTHILLHKNRYTRGRFHIEHIFFQTLQFSLFYSYIFHISTTERSMWLTFMLAKQ